LQTSNRSRGSSRKGARHKKLLRITGFRKDLIAKEELLLLALVTRTGAPAGSGGLRLRRLGRLGSWPDGGKEGGDRGELGDVLTCGSHEGRRPVSAVNAGGGIRCCGRLGF
jgi:hypothetical protein